MAIVIHALIASKLDFGRVFSVGAAFEDYGEIAVCSGEIALKTVGLGEIADSALGTPLEVLGRISLTFSSFLGPIQNAGSCIYIKYSGARIFLFL